MDEQYIIDLKVKTPGVEPATKKIKALEEEMAKLEKTSESYKQKQIEVARVQNASGESSKKLGTSVESAKGSIGDLTKGLGGLGGVLGVVAGVLTTAAVEVFSIEKRFASLKKEVGRTSGLLGGNLDKAAVSITALATTFNKETSEINKAADAFAKQTGTSYVQALELIQKGFLQGADANGDFLDKLREYPIQFKEAGFSAEDFIKIATQEARGGIFGDKLLDSVKELGLSIRELDKAQTDALTGAFGSAFTKDFVARVNSGKLSVKDALGVIITESNKAGLSVQATQKLTADLFKGAGEDAGGFKNVIEQLVKAQEINLDVLDKLGEAQREQLKLQTDLAEQELKLANAFDGLSSSVGNFTVVAKTELLGVLNAIIESLDLADAKTNRLAKAYTDGFSTKPIEDVNAEILNLEASQTRLISDIGKLEKAIDGTYNPLKLREYYSQLYSAEENRVRIEKQLGLLREIQVKKQGESSAKEIADTKAIADAKLKSEEDRKKAQEDRKKAQEAEKKRLENLIKVEKENFEKLKKSFKDNFESQRLEAQKQFLSGLITEEELATRLFAINQQENDVLITITANKKEAAKTGRESVDIAEEEVKKLKGIADELDRQLAIRQKIRDAERSIQDSEFSISSSELKIEEENAIQSILTDTSIKNEEKRQKKIEKTKKQFAIRQRQLAIEDTKRQIADAAKEAADLQKVLDEQSANGGSEEIDLFKTDQLAKDIAQIQKLKAELSLLNTQQKEAEKELKKPDESLVDKAERYNSYIQAITQGFQQANQADIAATESSLSAQEARIAAGVELAKLGNDELLNQELERQDKLLEEREKQANKEKAIAAIQVAANLGVAIAKAAAEGGILAPATIALVLGAVGIGFASIGALVGGAFADGVIDFRGRGTERSDSNIVAISRGESVITAKGTKNASKMLTMINEGKLKDSDYLTAGLDLQPIQAVNQAIDMRDEMNQQIALASELLEEMRSFYTKVEFTDKGIEQFVNTRNQRITKLNSR